MSRIVIALDTGTEAIGLGIAEVDGADVRLLAGGHEMAPRQANTRLLPALNEMMRDAGVSLSDVGGVLVGRGPGSFTGVRIGVATAKGLAQGLGVPLVGVGTLDAIAWRLRECEGHIGVVGDAMRGEVYPALFRCEGGRPKRLSADRVAPPEEVAVEWARSVGGPLMLAGNGLVKHAAVFAQALGEGTPIADGGLWWPDGEGLFGALGLAGGEPLFEDADPALVLPVYTRLSDAEEAERVRTGAGAAATPSSGVAGGPSDAGSAS